MRVWVRPPPGLRCRQSTQELGSSFRENYAHSLCSAGTYTARLLLRARPSPLMGTLVPRPGFCLKVPIPETTPHPGRDGPSSPQRQRTDGSKWKGVAPWVSFGKEVFVPPRLKAGVSSLVEMLGRPPWPDSRQPAWPLPLRSIPGREKAGGVAPAAGPGPEAPSTWDQSLPQQPNSHTSWGSQMFTSLHICTTPAPKASLIYHPWSRGDTAASSKMRVWVSMGPSCVLPLISASVCQCLESPDHSSALPCPFLGLVSTSRTPSHIPGTLSLPDPRFQSA